MSKINFIYLNERYPVNYQLIKKHTDYFLQQEKAIDEAGETNIYLVDEFDRDPNLSNEAIHNFVKYFEDEEIKMTRSNILSLKYLTNKFRITKLEKEVDDYIQENYKQLIEEILDSISAENNFNQKYLNRYQEELLSFHISEYVDRGILHKLPINVLFRLLKFNSEIDQISSPQPPQQNLTKGEKSDNIKFKSVSSQNESQNPDENSEELPVIFEFKMIDFLIEILKYHGKEACFLIELTKMSKLGTEHFIEKVHEEKESIEFDANFLSPKIIDFLFNQREEMKKKEKKHCEELKEMKAEYEQKIMKTKDDFNQQFEEMKKKEKKHCEELKEIKAEYEQKIVKIKDDFNQQLEEMKNHYDDKINDIFNLLKKNDEKQTKKQEECDSNIISIQSKNNELKTSIDNYNKEVREEISTESSKLFILINKMLAGKSDNDNNNSKISDFYSIVAYLSKENIQSKRPIKLFESIFVPETNKSFDEIILQSGNDEYFNANNNLGIRSEAVEMLYSNDSFNLSDFMSHFNNYSKVIFELRRSSSNFDLIIDKISEQKKIPFKTSCKFLLKVIFEGSKIEQIKKKIEIVDLVYIGPTINRIDKNDFSNFSSILEITIPSSVKILDDRCFYGCSSLEKVVIPKSITEINDSLFECCKSLVSVEIPSSVKVLKNRCFYGCSSLKKVVIPKSITEINDSVFECCKSLISIVIPSSVKVLKTRCFYGCSSLEKVVIPESITEINDSVFECCKSLREITFKSQLKKIGRNAFKGCSSLSNITIPETVTSIGESSFSECSSLIQMKIPPRLNKIESLAFYCCSKLKEISIPESVVSIGNNAFESCTSLLTIDFPFKMTKIGKCSFSKCSSLTHIFIPQSVSEIGDGAFEFCTSLCVIGIPKVFSIGSLGISDKVMIVENNKDSSSLVVIGNKLKKILVL